MSRCTLHLRKLVDKAFTKGLSGRQYRRLRVHLPECESCSERYTRLNKVHLALAPHQPFLPLVLENMSVEVRAAASPVHPRRHTYLALASLTAAAAVLAIAVWPRDVGTPIMTPRGGDDDGRFLGDRQPGARLFCIREIEGTPSVVGQQHTQVPGFPIEPLVCRIGDELQLAYSSPSLGALTMVAFSRDEEGNAYWYAPLSSQESSLPMQADAIDEPLPWSTRLSVQHEPGHYDVTVRFFDRPVLAGDAADGGIEPVFELRTAIELEEAPL